MDTSSRQCGCGIAAALLLILFTLSPQSVLRAVAASGLDERPPNPNCTAPDKPSSALPTTEGVYRKLAFNSAVQLQQHPGFPGTWLIVQQTGFISAFDGTDEDVSTMSVLLDISDRVAFTVGAGLTSVSFHPQYPADGRIFVTYTTQSGNAVDPVRNILASYTSQDGGLTFDAASEQIVLVNDTPGSAHPWGMAAFGPDGYLYIGAGGNEEHAQNTYKLNNAFIRLDVDSAVPYAIPPDNPYVNGGGAPEVFAKGFRNPFRWSFDLQGRLLAGDVGSSLYEEINHVQSGGNYGWPITEGFICREPPCDDPDIIGPIAGFDRDRASEGASAILAGLVYQGSAIPSLANTYIFSDFVTGTIRAAIDNGDGTFTTTIVGENGRGNHMTQGPDGEVYIIRNTQIRRLVPPADTGNTSFPQTVSEIGCFDAIDPKLPGQGMIPYDINVPLWSDNTAKERWFTIPDGELIDISPAGDFEFPIGSLLFKNFHLDGKLIETRMLALHNDGEWAGYSYEWDDTETEGYLVDSEGKEKTIGSQLYAYPSRGQCLQCHTSGAGITLGPEIQQLNRDFYYPSSGLTGNQLETYAHIGLLSEPLPATPDSLPALPAISDTGVRVHDRARGYLHANCSHCHMPGESGGGNFDLRSSSLSTGAINTAPSGGDLGVPGALIITPGNPALSIMPLRMRALDADRMPPISTNVVHPEGVDLIEEWIVSLGGAPSVAIDAPIEGAEFLPGEDIAITATASDDGSVVKVEFFASGEKLGEDTSAPFEYLWTGAAEGAHDLVAVAHDDQQVSSPSLPVSITVCNDDDGNGSCDVPPPPPPPEGTVALTLGTLDEGQYGNRYGPGPALAEVVATFNSPSQPLWLYVSGFDIDPSESVTVRINGTEIGQLSGGPNNQLNDGDVFIIDAALVQDGHNELRFTNSRDGSKWGMTNLLVTADGNLPPSVSIAAPAPGSVHVEGDDILIEAIASDDGQVTLVEFFADGAKLGETAAPFSFTWMGAPAGSHALTAVAHDDDLATTTSQVVTVSVCADADDDGACDAPPPPPPPPPPPDGSISLVLGELDQGQYGNRYGPGEALAEVVVRFDSPSQMLWLFVTGFDIDQAETVNVQVNGTTLGQLTPGPNNQLNDGDIFVIDASLVLDGENELRFSNTRAGSKWGMTNLLVTADGNLPPSVTIVSPAPDSQFVEGDDIPMEAAASDDGLVTLVEYFADGVKLGEATAPFSFIWTGVPPGSHNLTAVAHDDELASTTSAAVTVSVCADGDGDGACDAPPPPPPPPPPPDGSVNLTLGLLDQGQYGNRYGPEPHLAEVVALFDSPNQPLTLYVTGYDIDLAETVTVSINGVAIGQLSPGPDNGLNDGDVFLIEAGLVIDGQNEFRFTNSRARSKWGITNLLVIPEN